MCGLHLLTAIAIASFAAAAPAEATPTISNQANCSLTSSSPDAVACSGFWDANLLNNSPTALSAQQTALSSIGYNFDTSTFNSLSSVSSLSGGLLDFGHMLYGITYIAVDFNNPGFGNGTVFYEFNFGSAGSSGIALNTGSFSSAVLYEASAPAVPEPATWAMMLLGFGAIGGALRRRPKPMLAQLA